MVVVVHRLPGPLRRLHNEPFVMQNRRERERPTNDIVLPPTARERSERDDGLKRAPRLPACLDRAIELRLPIFAASHQGEDLTAAWIERYQRRLKPGVLAREIGILGFELREALTHRFLRSTLESHV